MMPAFPVTGDAKKCVFLTLAYHFIVIRDPSKSFSRAMTVAYFCLRKVLQCAINHTGLLLAI